jgi:hypothetical protein
MKRLLIVAVALVALFAASPAFDGYHLGCNGSFGDNTRLTRMGVGWCKHTETTEEAERVAANEDAEAQANKEAAERPSKEAALARENEEHVTAEAGERARLEAEANHAGEAG